MKLFPQTRALIRTIYAELLLAYQTRTQALSNLATSIDEHRVAIINQNTVHNSISSSVGYLAKQEHNRLVREGHER